MASEQAIQTSTVGTKWARRMIIFSILLLGLGIWATWDAFWVYPKRGAAFAEWAEWQYLVVLDDESRAMADPGILTRNAPVSDPQAELARLRRERNGLDRRSEVARYEWLNALALIGQLTPERTSFADIAPRQRLAELTSKWQSSKQPAPLKGYDIPSQYLMMLVGYGLFLYIAFLLVRVYATKYRWDPQTRTLTLPGGASITPADLEEVDKRKWDKFIVFLKIKPGVDRVGGASIRVDTFRHGRVEDWILEMEREAFGAEEDTTQTPEAQPDDQQSDHTDEEAPTTS